MKGQELEWLPDLYDLRTLKFDIPMCFRKQRVR
jgi:hypothetical protein